jgi:hypothetical protein
MLLSVRFSSLLFGIIKIFDSSKVSEIIPSFEEGLADYF